MTPITGIIYGLDLGTDCGIAYGRPGGVMGGTSMRLKRASEHRAIAFSNLMGMLIGLFELNPPALVVKERMLHTAALIKISGASDANSRMHGGLHAIVEAVCGRYGVPWTEVADSTVRKHFIGNANAGSRDETKRAVMRQCFLLGLLPDGCRGDDNLADAAATWHWACATYSSRLASPKELFLWGEQRREAVA